MIELKEQTYKCMYTAGFLSCYSLLAFYIIFQIANISNLQYNDSSFNTKAEPRIQTMKL